MPSSLPIKMILIGAIMLSINALAADISLIQTKERFLDNEPVVLRMQIKNTSKQDIVLPLEYPDELGLTFSANDTSIVQNKNRGYILGQVRISSTTIPPNATLDIPVCLNRYFMLAKANTYEFRWSFSRQDAKNSVLYNGSGKIKIKITKSNLSFDIEAAMIEIKKGDKNLIRKTLEPLLYWNDLRVIPVLVDAARVDPDTAPGFCAEIVESLSKFIHCDVGRDALFNVMSISLAGFGKGLEICPAQGIEIPEYLIKQGLSGGYNQFYTLEFLLKFGNAKHISLVEPLATNSNPIIANLAKEFLKKHILKGK